MKIIIDDHILRYSLVRLINFIINIYVYIKI